MYAHLQAFQLVADYQTPGANLSPGSIDGSYRQDTAPSNQGKLYPDNFNKHNVFSVHGRIDGSWTLKCACNSEHCKDIITMNSRGVATAITVTGDDILLMYSFYHPRPRSSVRLYQNRNVRSGKPARRETARRRDFVPAISSRGGGGGGGGGGGDGTATSTGT